MRLKRRRRQMRLIKKKKADEAEKGDLSVWSYERREVASKYYFLLVLTKIGGKRMKNQLSEFDHLTLQIRSFS